MHPVLCIDEVLREVIGWLGCSPATLALALTCRLICDVALPVLWNGAGAWALAMAMPEQYRRIQLSHSGKVAVGA